MQAKSGFTTSNNVRQKERGFLNEDLESLRERSNGTTTKKYLYPLDDLSGVVIKGEHMKQTSGQFKLKDKFKITKGKQDVKRITSTLVRLDQIKDQIDLEKAKSLASRDIKKIIRSDNISPKGSRNNKITLKALNIDNKNFNNEDILRIESPI